MSSEWPCPTNGPWAAWIQVSGRAWRPTNLGFYKDGKSDGLQIIFNDDGTLHQIMTYRMGVPDGPTVIFDAHGVPVELANFKDGVRLDSGAPPVVPTGGPTTPIP